MWHLISQGQYKSWVIRVHVQDSSMIDRILFIEDMKKLYHVLLLCIFSMVSSPLKNFQKCDIWLTCWVQIICKYSLLNLVQICHDYTKIEVKFNQTFQGSRANKKKEWTVFCRITEPSDSENKLKIPIGDHLIDSLVQMKVAEFGTNQWDTFKVAQKKKEWTVFYRSSGHLSREPKIPIWDHWSVILALVTYLIEKGFVVCLLERMRIGTGTPWLKEQEFLMI